METKHPENVNIERVKSYLERQMEIALMVNSFIKVNEG